MRLLLDENLPRKLKYRFEDKYEVITVPDMERAGIKNGDLLEKMESNGLSILITLDKNMSKQQNLLRFGVTLIVLTAVDTRYASLLKLLPELKQRLSEKLEPGLIEIR